MDKNLILTISFGFKLNSNLKTDFTFFHNAPINVLPGGRGAGAGVGIFIRHTWPRKWLFTLWTRPRVRIFDFSLSLSRGRAVLIR